MASDETWSWTGADAPGEGAEPGRAVQDKAGEDKGGDGLSDKVAAGIKRLFGGREAPGPEVPQAENPARPASDGLPGPTPSLAEARGLVHEARRSAGTRRTALARRALSLSPNCAEAYVLLAEEQAADLKEARDLFEQGMRAGERALEPDAFRLGEGRMWQNPEARPYLRARLGLSYCLWEMGQKRESIRHLEELLRLNASDESGARFALGNHLIELGQEEELGAWLVRWAGDRSPEILYIRALWTFRREGGSEAANQRLGDALRANPGIAAYLLKKRKPPKRPKAGPAPDADASSVFVYSALEPWHKTLGAVEWLAAHFEDLEMPEPAAL